MRLEWQGLFLFQCTGEAGRYGRERKQRSLGAAGRRIYLQRVRDRRYACSDDGGALCRAAGCGCVRVDLRLYGEGAEGAVGRSRQWVYGGLRADGESALRGTDPNATAVARRGGGSGFACDALPTATEKTEVSQKMKALRHELAK